MRQRPLTVVYAAILLVGFLQTAGSASAQGYNLLVGGGSFDDDCDPSDGHWGDETVGWFVDLAHAGGPNGGNGRILVLDVTVDPDCDTTGMCAYLECQEPGTTADHACVTDVGGGGCLMADDQATHDLIVGYDALWFRGGDQSQYTTEWVGSLTESAIHAVWSGGGALGGTSAGAMIQSEVVSTGGATSWEATTDPYDPEVELTLDFLDGVHAVLPGTLVDTHFLARARTGRLATYVARLLQDESLDLVGIGVGQETALAVGPSGIATVLGQGEVAFVHPLPETTIDLQPGLPPSISALRVHWLTEGFAFDLGLRALASVPPTATHSHSPPYPPQHTATTVLGAVEADAAKGRWEVVGRTEPGALYRGALTIANGATGLDNASVMTNLEASSDQRENRAGGPLWALKENPRHGLAVYTDGFGAQSCNGVDIAVDGTLTARPGLGCPDEEAVLVVDCCGLQLVGQSTWVNPPGTLPRQSVTLTPCALTLFNTQLGPPSYRSACADLLFSDGFERGDVGAWSGSQP